MSRITESIEVDVPNTVAYNQWTQFEEFPQFMEGIEQVRQLDDTTLEWTANIAGKTKVWKATITEQTPDQRISWQATEGAPNAGTVWFEPAGANMTRVHLELEYEPEGIVESAGDALGFVQRRTKGDLERFKEFIESRGRETGAWRGEVEGGQVAGDASMTGSGMSGAGMSGTAAGAGMGSSMGGTDGGLGGGSTMSTGAGMDTGLGTGTGASTYGSTGTDYGGTGTSAGYGTDYGGTGSGTPLDDDQRESR